jgi:ribosome maturation factor RimP
MVYPCAISFSILHCGRDLKVGLTPAFFLSLMDGKRTASVADYVAGMAEPILVEMGLELVEVQFRREQAGWILRLIIFRPTGITVEDCAIVSREVGNLLDVEDVIEQPYHLEVSSPGLDRPLKTARDFGRYRGQKVKVVAKTQTADHQEIIGVIGEVMEGSVTLVAGHERFEIPYDQIAKARLVIEF